MAEKKYGRKATTIICLKLVESHEERKIKVAELKYEIKNLYEKISSMNITDIPTSHSNISDSVFVIYSKIEKINNAIVAQQHRIDVVETAINNIGKNIEKDEEIRKKMRDGILHNIQLGGYKMPFEYTAYPEKYNQKAFYQHRKAFLNEIADKLYLR